MPRPEVASTLQESISKSMLLTFFEDLSLFIKNLYLKDNPPTNITDDWICIIMFLVTQHLITGFYYKGVYNSFNTPLPTWPKYSFLLTLNKNNPQFLQNIQLEKSSFWNNSEHQESCYVSDNSTVEPPPM